MLIYHIINKYNTIRYNGTNSVNNKGPPPGISDSIDWRSWIYTVCNSGVLYHIQHHTPLRTAGYLLSRL